MTFLLDNILLIAIAIVSGGLLLWPLLRRGDGAVSLGPLEATQLINHRNAIVVDVRDADAYATGSLAGARNLPQADLATRIAEVARFKSRPVLVVCDSGQRSTKALAAFREQGFEEAHVLAGGIAAWKQAGLPLVQATRTPARETNAKPRKGDGRGKSGRTPAAMANTPAAPVAPVAAVPSGASAATSPAPSASSGADPTPSAAPAAAATPMASIVSASGPASATVASPKDAAPAPSSADVAEPPLVGTDTVDLTDASRPLKEPT